ncbi:MAG TPA: L,D-transpeptidase/peptidoglycan binding protein [Candidatus Mediterraneibacter quadrami]|uniref:L,D-transpeptidase/peptidoglycan binding protein n=1 Tax=Candidatus Mediterraneibacter quadrami TaxID=2838684 RepID=A0A9D2RDC4_9FIRM|nr:L,D-transpeptidase/peptidoglycan binding protein [Candidatus Mediterraneibacter quadrami]
MPAQDARVRRKRSGKWRRGRHNARKRERKLRERKPLGKKPFIIAGSIVGGLVLIYLGVAAFFMSHFLVNTTINGKDFSGKTVADVEAYLKEQVDGYQLTLVEQNNITDTISGSEISLEYKKNKDVEKALEDQRQLLWITSFFSKSDTDVTVDVEYDEAALEEKIQTIKAVTGEQTEPVSAHPEYDGNSFVVAAETLGTAVNQETLTSKIKEYITNFEPKLNLLDEGCYNMPKYTSESPEVQKACDTMNQYLKASITYSMDEDVVVDKELISEWLSYDENMQASFDEDAVREWMRDFGSKYDTKGKTRSITTPTGKTTEVSGGTYGWIVDEDTETKNLIDSIKKGEVVTREPAYKQKAASRGAQDWGDTYLEVDISAQHMWYIVDGSVALESDVVTGLPNGERDTPTGVYSVIEMMRNKVLKGSINPSTGKPSYETPVSYWMRITWTGIGFHDATWQASFGGSWYQGHGSHGCINMPLEKAKSLYGMLKMGTPAIVHK